VVDYTLDHEAFASGPRLGGSVDDRPPREPLDTLEVDRTRRTFSEFAAGN